MGLINQAPTYKSNHLQMNLLYMHNYFDFKYMFSEKKSKTLSVNISL